MHADNSFEGPLAKIKTLFAHSKKEVGEKMEGVRDFSDLVQQDLLSEELSELKITMAQIEQQQKQNANVKKHLALENVHPLLQDLNKSQMDKVSQSLLRQLNDKKYAEYNAIIDIFIKKNIR